MTLKVHNKFKLYLSKYFKGLTVPKISSDSKEILVEEISRMAELLKKYPNITYSDLWDKIHDLE